MSEASTSHSVATPFERMGGETAVRALVDRFYDLMDEDSQVAVLRDMHARSLRVSRDKLYKFLCGWLGGPDYYVREYGHPRLRRRHMPFSIGESERDQWMKCMNRALDEQLDDVMLREQLKSSLYKVADFMRNREEG